MWTFWSYWHRGHCVHCCVTVMPPILLLRRQEVVAEVKSNVALIVLWAVSELVVTVCTLKLSTTKAALTQWWSQDFFNSLVNWKPSLALDLHTTLILVGCITTPILLIITCWLKYSHFWDPLSDKMSASYVQMWTVVLFIIRVQFYSRSTIWITYLSVQYAVIHQWHGCLLSILSLINVF